MYYVLYESHIDSHTIAWLIVAFRSTALAVEHEAPVREGVVGGTVGSPTIKSAHFLSITIFLFHVFVSNGICLGFQQQ